MGYASYTKPSWPFFVLAVSVLCSEFGASMAQRYGASSSLVQISCVHARYPRLCFRTLSAFSASVKTRSDLAKFAVSASLGHTRRVSRFLSGVRGANRPEKKAISDCIEQLSDSVDELHRSLGQLKLLRRKSFRWQMSNVQTWVSGALTNEDTCLDGFKGLSGSLKTTVSKRIRNASRITSNALYLINCVTSPSR